MKFRCTKILHILALNDVCLSVVQHGLAIQSVAALPCAMGGEAVRHNQQNTVSHAAPSRGRRVLSTADNPEVDCIAAGLQSRSAASHSIAIAAGLQSRSTAAQQHLSLIHI